MVTVCGLTIFTVQLSPKEEYMWQCGNMYAVLTLFQRISISERCPALVTTIPHQTRVAKKCRMFSEHRVNNEKFLLKGSVAEAILRECLSV